MNKDEDNKPKTPLEAAIDAATGYKPGEEDGGAEAAEVRTADETKQAEVKENAAPEKGKRDWVKEAYECFLKGKPRDTEPLGVIRSFYEANASEELKAKCKAEGKTPEGAYEFMKAVMREAGGTSISDSVGLSICMHYFQDVPALADFEPKLKAAEEKKRMADFEKRCKEKQEKHNAEVRAKAAKKAAKTRKKNAKAGTNAKIEALKEKIPQAGSVAHQRELKEKLKAEKAKLKGQKPKKGGKEQGFFFDLMETETASPAGEGGAAC